MLAMSAGITIVAAINGKLLRTTGIQISDLDARSEVSKKKSRSNRFIGSNGSGDDDVVP